MSSTPLQTPMNWTLWQIAITISAVFGVNFTAHSYEAPNCKMLWGYPYVKYPIANTYELDPMADGHSCQRSVWSELTAHSYEAPHCKMLWGYPYVEYPIASTYELDPMADGHSYQSSVWSWSEPYRTQLRSTQPHSKKAMGLTLCGVSRSKHLYMYELDTIADSHSYMSSARMEGTKHQNGKAWGKSYVTHEVDHMQLWQTAIPNS